MGLDLGCESAGVTSRLVVEKDTACRKTIRLNRPDLPYLDDVTKVTATSVRRLVGKVDVIIGGPPCQSFSMIGRRRSLRDVRGQLLFEYLRIVSEVQPRFFAMENVAGLLSAQKDGQPVIGWLMHEFSQMGYNVGWWKLNSCDFGSAQTRQRVVIIGNRQGAVLQPEPCRGRIDRLGDVIEDMETEPGECTAFSTTVSGFLDKITEGENWKALSVKDRKKAMGNADLKSGGLVGFYRRLSYNRPSPTLLTSPIHRATTLCHPRKTRPLSIPEYARIQGFPMDWQLTGSTTQKYRQLGNAVPLALGEAIGRALIRMASV